jgi:tetratricopeptide (TPR) repeat protein
MAIHCQIAAEQLTGKDNQEAQAMLLNAQNALLLCHQQMEGVARSHGSVIAKTETYSLDERIRVLEKLDREYSPDDPLILNRLGASHLLLHNSDEAISVFDRAFAIEKRPKPLINKAAALEQKAWRVFNLQCDVSAASDYYGEAISVLHMASRLHLEKGDESKCGEDLKRMNNLLNIMQNDAIPLYPSQLIHEFSRGQRDFADQYMRIYRQEGADVNFISKMVKKRFDLQNSDQALQCACEMLEDFCPGFIASILVNLNRYAIPLIASLLSIAEDERHGVMTMDAREAISVFGIMDCNDSHDCAERMGIILSVTNIDKVRFWMEDYLERGLSSTVCSPFEWIKRFYIVSDKSTNANEGWDVFISYSTTVDALRTQGLCHFLEQRGLRCWMAPRNILPGEEWQAAIRRGLRNTRRCIVVVLSSSSGNSKQVAREVASADQEGLIIIPFRIEESPVVGDVLQYYFSTTHWIDAFPPPGSEALSVLMDRIDALVSNIKTQNRSIGSNWNKGM